jgi:hypothetical protein
MEREREPRLETWLAIRRAVLLLDAEAVAGGPPWSAEGAPSGFVTRSLVVEGAGEVVLASFSSRKPRSSFADSETRSDRQGSSTGAPQPRPLYSVRCEPRKRVGNIDPNGRQTTFGNGCHETETRLRRRVADAFRPTSTWAPSSNGIHLSA